MNLTAHDIDYIVAEVVRRLANLSGGREPLESAPLPDKVITLETLRQHAGTELTVTAKAIVTPAARDELKKRGVKLIRGTVPQNKITHTTTGLLAANIAADYHPKTLTQLVASYGAALEQHPKQTLTAVIAAHCDLVVRESRQAIWFTRYPAHAVCLANRIPGVWALVGHDDATMKQALQSFPANVLAIDPQGKSQYGLRKMIDAFAGSGAIRGS